VRVALAALILAVAWPSAAQPRLTGAQVNERPFTESIEAALRQPGGTSDAPASWLAWAVPVADGRSTMCCYSGWNDGSRSGGTCRLEPGSSSTVMTRDGNRALRLEPAETFFVFVRIQNRQVERVRMFSEDCEVEAQGTAVTWLTSVPPAASVAFLEGVAGEADVTARASKGALAALAQHAAAESTTALVRLARRAPDSDLRGDALFWLSQRAGERAVGAITEAIEHDPETQVKKKAVFALSQLPAGEGVPKLIEVARTNRNPAVRKQAMFWLGQSKDPRALTFFEQILK
jgi:hypothetical protein